MNPRRSLFALVGAFGFIVALSACFGNGGGPPLPLAVEFSIAPPASDALGTNFQVAAVVSDGSKVNWSCSPANACGSFNPTQTASNASTTYMPPATVPTGGSVTIMAISAEDATKEASANVNITSGGAVSVTFSAPAPPPSLATNATAQVTATITSTVTNAVSDGVDWTATCTNSAGGGCGMFSAAHTNSGVATTYTPPTTVPAGGVAVTIKAASTLDSQDSVTAVIDVSTTQTSAFLCAGCTYTYTVSGETTNGFYSLAGVLTTDGLGNIKGGEQDFSEVSFTTGVGVGYTTGNTPDTLAAGTTYSFGPDGRGTITLSTGDSHIGPNGNGIEVLGVVFVSPTHLLITELDQSATASGTMDLQTVHAFTLSTLSGGYAFVFAGSDGAGNPLAFGGVFKVDSPGTISGAGSTCDINEGGSFARQQGLTGIFIVTDAVQGRIQLTLRSSAFGSVGLTGPMVLDGYITDATHVKLVEEDLTIAISSGLAVGQGAATGSFTTAAALPANSSYVVTGFGSGVTGALALVATLTSDGNSNLNNPDGTNGANSDVNLSGSASSGSVTGKYSVDSAGTGRVGVTLNGNVGVPGNSAMYAVYLTGGPDPPMTMEVDGNGITSGNAYVQSAGPFSLTSFQGSYGLNFTLFGFDSTDQMYDIEVDISGQSLADGAGNLLGMLDINDAGIPTQNVVFTGSYASSASGRFTGSITSTSTSTLNFSYFVVSPSQVVFIETDSQAVSLGIFQLQTPPF